jgi:hypothetical protein
MSLFNDPNRIPENYGIKMAAGLIAYFLIMRVASLGHVVELRLLNVFILTAGVYGALKKFKNSHHENLNYFRGLVTGVSAAGIGSLIFGAFLFIYMKADAGFMESIKNNDPMGRHLNPYMGAFIVVLEGFFSGLLATFILLNWVNTDEVNNPQGNSN